MKEKTNHRLLGRYFTFLLTSLFLLLGFTLTARAASVGQAVITNVKTISSDNQRVFWNPVSKASGYEFAHKKSTDKKWTRKMVEDGSATYVGVGKRVPEVTYRYRVRAYRIVKGKTKWGHWSNIYQSSLDKEIAVYGQHVDYSAYGRFFASRRSQSFLRKITVKTWDFAKGSSGRKITRTWTITVNKKVANSLIRAFNEIYKSPDKFPIHDLGGWRPGTGRSEHYDGTAIDINPDENYQISHGVILCGSYWRPGSDPYSIPKNGTVAKILKKYGFSQGIWSSSQDYMHFSYFGT